MTCVSLPSGRFSSCPAGCFLALGCFDGLHVGHRTLLETSAALARERGIPFAVWTPVGAKNVPQIRSSSERRAQLFSCGAGYLLCDRFDAIRDLSARSFFEDLLIGRYRARALSCGENFTFGKDRSGNVGVLEALCRQHGIFLYVADMVKTGGVAVSDSMIRSLLSGGNVLEANRLLCAPYGFTARSVRGRGVGTGLGFPTVNLPLPDHFLLPFGVYAAELTVFLPGAAPLRRPAAVSVGVHPTFGAGEVPMCEAHLLENVSQDLHGRRVRVDFLKFFRSERTFSSPERLAAQIGEDLRLIGAFFEPSRS